MPRKIIPISTEHYYSISARCINKEWFQIPLEDVWKIMEDYLYFLSIGFNFKIKSFVLMNNHFHLIVKTPDGNLSEGMRYFMRETSRHIAKGSGRINQIYGARFYRSLISTNHYYTHAYKYVYRNPVEAALVESVLDYKFSTLGRLLGKGPLNIPIEYDEILFDSKNIQETLNWLNTTPTRENYKIIKTALRKSEFYIPRDKVTKYKNPLEDLMY